MSSRRLWVRLCPNEPMPQVAVPGLAVVIDVLRATTTVVAALENGARGVLPVAGLEDARRLREQLGDTSEVLLGGERGGKRLPGFDLGNSPLEYTRQKVAGRLIILTTTNGTQALTAAQEARVGTILVACFRNAAAVARKLQEESGPVTVLCAGTEGRFSFEDALCAGLLVHLLQRYAAWTLSDGARAALAVWDGFGAPAGSKLREALEMGDHGRALEEMGFHADLDYAASSDESDIVPRMSPDGVLVGG